MDMSAINGRRAVGDVWSHYLQSRSVWRTAKAYGVVGQTIHRWLTDAGYKLYNSKWTLGEDSILSECYAMAGAGNISLAVVAERVKRSEDACCQRAAELGLTDKRRPMTAAQKKMAARITGERMRNGHPNKGRKFGPVSAERKLAMGAASRALWARHKASGCGLMSPMNIHKRKLAGYRMAAKSNANGTTYSRCAGGKREDLGNAYYRSSWEANIARYLNWLLKIGAVKEWDYETVTFEFHKVRRGNRFYKPDFRILFAKETEHIFWEVKGWMDSASKTRLSRMARYYPTVKLIVIGQKEYRQIAGECRGVIPNWESGRKVVAEC